MNIHLSRVILLAVFAAISFKFWTGMGDMGDLKIGVLALQGAFLEHMCALERCGVDAREIRTLEQLNEVDGLVLPGGESTTMALIAEANGLMEPLREFAQSGKPMLGTCAGLILLADRLTAESATKHWKQSSIGGLNVTCARNRWGRQTESFTCKLKVPALGFETQATFIRAPGKLCLFLTPHSP
jgi:5'-phosphate synthase pdxT subunit